MARPPANMAARQTRMEDCPRTPTNPINRLPQLTQNIGNAPAGIFFGVGQEIQNIQFHLVSTPVPNPRAGASLSPEGWARKPPFLRDYDTIDTVDVFPP